MWGKGKGRQTRSLMSDERERGASKATDESSHLSRPGAMGDL